MADSDVDIILRGAGVETVDVLKAKVQELHGSLDSLDKSGKRASTSMDGLAKKMTTLNPRLIATRLSVTALAFALLNLARNADKAVIAMDNLDEATRKNAEGYGLLKKGFSDLGATIQFVLVGSIGRMINDFTAMISKWKGMTNEQINAQRQMKAYGETVSKVSKEQDKLNLKLQDEIDLMKEQDPIKKALLQNSLEYSNALLDLTAKFDVNNNKMVDSFEMTREYTQAQDLLKQKFKQTSELIAMEVLTNWDAYIAKLNEATSGNDNMTESQKAMYDQAAELTTQLDALKSLLDAGKITFEEYAQRVRESQEAVMKLGEQAQKHVKTLADFNAEGIKFINLSGGRALNTATGQTGRFKDGQFVSSFSPAKEKTSADKQSQKSQTGG